MRHRLATGSSWLAVTAAVGLSAGACAQPASGLIILQNQVPTFDSMAHACSATGDSSESIRQSGRFDVDLDKPYPYVVYPLIQSRLPSIVASGGVERNSIVLQSVRVEIRAPAGIDPGWAPGCPAAFDSPAAAVLDPAQSRVLSAQGFQTCHSSRLRELINNGAISGDSSQPVYFTLELTAVADRSGSQLLSNSFPFQVQVCAGCLQSMFPNTPNCADAPKPNPLPGNPCNIAQDGPDVLCCLDAGGALKCPAPDM